jgi:hypothetical protein
MALGVCEVHGGEPTEVEHIQFCGESVKVCLSCLETQTGTSSKAEFQDIQDDRYYEYKTKLLEATGK